jgi:hypothetical protein
MLMHSYAYYLSLCMFVKLLSIYYSWMMHEKGKTPFCAKIGIVMSLLIFKI